MDDENRGCINERNKLGLTKSDNLYLLIKDTNLIKKLINFLFTNSNTKKDVAILLLLHMTCCESILKMMLCDEIISKLIEYINSFKKTSIYFLILAYNNYREHVIVTLQLLRKLYVHDIELRKRFLDLNGVILLNEFLFSGDVDIVIEVLFNIEDLIYVKFE